LLVAHHLERIVDAAAPGDPVHLGDRVAFRGVHHVRGPELQGPLELLLHHVHGDDPRRAHEARRLDRVEADAAAAEHGHAGPRGHLGLVDDRPGAGEDAAAHERDHVQRGVLTDGNDARLRQDRSRGVPADLQVLVEALAVLPETERAVVHERTGLVAERAKRRGPVDTVAALAARRDVARAHVVADLHGLDQRADLLHDSGRLVTEDHGQRVGRVAGHQVIVAVADAVGGPTDLHLVRSGLQQLDLLDDQRLLDLVQHGCRCGEIRHGRPPCVSVPGARRGS
jgi:hypothetical protein